MSAQQLSNMIELAARRHNGQFDKAGQPYILHCLKVMHYTKSNDLEVLAIAVGHDLIEDTFPDVISGQMFLRAQGFSERIIEGISALSKRKDQSYEDYKNQVKSNLDAIIVKLADLRHNSDIRRLKGVTDKDIARTRRYHEFYLELEKLK